MPLIVHRGGPRHGEVDDLPARALTTSLLVYDGPRWFAVYQRSEPLRTQDTGRGRAEVWTVRE